MLIKVKYTIDIVLIARILFFYMLFTLFCNVMKVEEQGSTEKLIVREKESRITCHPYYVWKTQEIPRFCFRDNERIVSGSIHISSKGRLYRLNVRICRDILLESTVDTVQFVQLYQQTLPLELRGKLHVHQ